MASVLLVSKPLVPPWNDSSKNLARDVAGNLTRHEALTFDSPRDTKLRVLARLASARADLWHFFFAPNPRTSTVARALARVRRIPSVQTVCSRPKDMSQATRWLFADRTVVLSRATRDALLSAGLEESRVRYVPPGVPPLTPLGQEARGEARRHFELDPDAPLIVFPGDLEFGDGADRMLASFEKSAIGRDATLVMACRAKTPAAKGAEERLRDRARSLGIAERVRWVGETRRIHDLLGCADVVALPSTDLYAKMDLPLVLIEAMWLERAVLVCEGAAAAELADGGAARLAPASPEGCAEALDALGDPVARRALGDLARGAAESRYDPVSMVRAYESLYDELLP